MTHNDIYTKFMIEYDKANVTSSYPSLTEYEVATVLDKAYNALIAQKMTGNNLRRAPFEADIKSIEDLAPLVKRESCSLSNNNTPADNVKVCNMPSDHLYFIGCYLKAMKGYRTFLETSSVIKPTKNPLTDSFLGTVEVDIESLKKKPLFVKNPQLPCEKHTFAYNVPSGFIVNVMDISRNHNLRFVYSAQMYNEDAFDYMYAIYIKKNDKGVYVADDIEYQRLSDAEWFLEAAAKGYDYFIIMPAYVMNDVIGDNVLYLQDMHIDRNNGFPYDTKLIRRLPTQLVPHNTATKFFTTSYNMPWIKIPVCYIEDNKLYIVYDLLNDQIMDRGEIVYVKKPKTFVKDLDSLKGDESYNISYFDASEAPDTVKAEYEFELNPTMAEELISLAIVFALENVESQRLATKLNTRGLEQ